ncbi:MAG: hypothetical protein GY765_41310 [bacterium]|nr:hypothetical protein [bacterium]
MREVTMGDNNSYEVSCWFCTCAFEAGEANFCNHFDATLICPYCLKCACDAPDEYKRTFLKDCPSEILEEKLILESKTSLKLGEMLIRAGKINKDHLLKAIDTQKSFNKRIGQIFIMMNLLTPEELTVFLSEQKGIDVIDLEKFEIDLELVEKVGKQFCLTHKIIPIEYYQINREKILRFAATSKKEVTQLKQCNELEKYRLIPYEAPEEDIERLLQDIKKADVFLLQ